MELTTVNQVVTVTKKKKDKDVKGTPKHKEIKPTALKVIQDDELTSEMLKRKYLKTTNTEDDFYSNRNETASG